MSVNKAVILAAGMGKRMKESAARLNLSPKVREYAERGWKAFIPIRGRHFVEYQIMELADAGFRDVCLVISRKHLMLWDRFAELGEELDIRVTYAVQEKTLGTADAVYAAKNFVKNDLFMALNGDNFYPLGALRAVMDIGDTSRDYVAGFKMDSLVKSGWIGPEKVKAFSVIVADEDFNLIKIIEKSSNPEDYRTRHGILVNMNLWRLSPEIFQACRRIKPHPERGEFELTEAVQFLVDRGVRGVKVVSLETPVLDMTSAEDIPIVEKALEELGRMERGG